MTSCSTRGRWHPLHVVAVIAGFLIWWPLGLAALAYFIWGDRFPREKVREGFERAKAEFAGFTRDQHSHAGHGWSATGNAAFDDYRRETLRRLEEERRRLEEEGRAFAEFVANLRRARDKEEFDRFMAERNAARNGGDSHSA
ncbi:DUF2852 domain-containing protein [Labrys sp. LIt4]|uniref:DUF2852 domain-containing protein n=1 Tax=Labrys sp. LIt4 TaxID=2821355 RepID=UPI001ADF94F5|nr:DUF2852 domain-containing protein [Labrys sp. LIt4]MBP0582868.1 DUF2852 domain-containing protein [Labrys sp. LIt4]